MALRPIVQAELYCSTFGYLSSAVEQQRYGARSYGGEEEIAPRVLLMCDKDHDHEKVSI